MVNQILKTKGHDLTGSDGDICALVLVDEAFDNDRRVQASISELCCAVTAVNIGDFKDPATYSRRRLFWEMLTLAVRGVRPFIRLYPELRTARIDGWFRGLKEVRTWLSACDRAARHARLAHHEPISRILANDLYCGYTATLIQTREALIYDSHEVQFHRNRTTSLARIIIELGIDAKILSRSDEAIFVSHAIASLYQRAFVQLPRHRVRYNNFYPAVDTFTHRARDPESLTMVYVGKGLRGRYLELLASKSLSCQVALYTIGQDIPPDLDIPSWYYGPKDYQSDLVKLARTNRCMMWCAHINDKLSYKYALPNKFFQATALEIPIVAYEGTYVADIVKKYDIGIVINSYNLEKLIDAAKSASYNQWRLSISKFRSDLACLNI